MMTVGKTTSYSVRTSMEKKKKNPKHELTLLKHLESEEELKSLLMKVKEERWTFSSFNDQGLLLC